MGERYSANDLLGAANKPMGYIGEALSEALAALIEHGWTPNDMKAMGEAFPYASTTFEDIVETAATFVMLGLDSAQVLDWLRLVYWHTTCESDRQDKPRSWPMDSARYAKEQQDDRIRFESTYRLRLTGCRDAFYVAAYLAAADSDTDLALRTADAGLFNPAFLPATGGDVQAAILAEKAGLTVDETRNHTREGSLNLDVLRTLIGLARTARV